MKINLSITLFAKIKYEQLTITKVTILIKFKLDFLYIKKKSFKNKFKRRSFSNH